MTWYLCDLHVPPINLTSLVLAEKDQSPEYLYLRARAQVVDAIMGQLSSPHSPQDIPKIVKILTEEDTVDMDQRIVILPNESESSPYGIYDYETLARLVPSLANLIGQRQRTHPRRLDTREVSFLGIRETESDVLLLCDSEIPFKGAKRIVVPAIDGAKADGVYRVAELARVLAEAGHTKEALNKAMVDLKMDVPKSGREDDVWQVLAECPGTAGNATTQHKVVFEGPAGLSPPIIIGRAPSGRELALETAVGEDLTPPKSIERLNTQLKFVLAGQALITSLLTGLGWFSGTLASVVREAAPAFAIALLLTAGSVAVAVWGLIVGARRTGNLNDLVQVRKLYQSRITAMSRMVHVSTALYIAAVLVAIVPPIIAAYENDVKPAPVALTFDNATFPPTVTVKATVDGLKYGSSETLIIRAFRAADAASTDQGSVLLRQPGGPDSAGKTSFDAKLVVPPGTAVITAALISPEEASTECTPSTEAGGCTVMHLPEYAPSAGVRSFGAPSLTLVLGESGKPDTVKVDTTLAALAPAEAVTVVVMAYSGAADKTPDVLLKQGVIPDPSGKASVSSQLVVPLGSMWVTAQVFESGEAPPACSPSELASTDDGCTVLRVSSASTTV